jgi:Zn-dependent peptidase ImmA (M78 family)/transcriptional regulator with XRE-family HTH domain
MTRLQEALNAHKGNLSHLGSKSGVSVERLQDLVSGADPSMSELRGLSVALKVSLSDFAPRSDSFKKADVLFRSAARQPLKLPDDSIVEALSRKMGYSVDLLGSSNGVHRSAWSHWFSDVQKGNPEAFAQRFRKVFYSDDQVSPLLSLPQLIINQLHVVLFVINSPHLDGASAYLSGVPFIFVAERFPPRMLFTCAHELGHLLDHPGNNDDFASIDASDPDDRYWRIQEERFAHSFASALLLPRAGLAIALRKVRQLGQTDQDMPLGDVELLYASRIFGVSFEAAARRCEDLELLPRGAAASLNDKIKQEYGSAEKRADAIGLPPRGRVFFPQLSSALLVPVIEKIRSGELSIGKASTMLGLSISELLSANAQTVQ